MANFHADFIDGVLVGYDGENEQPFLNQPTWPDGTAWSNEAQAREFFAVLIESFVDKNAPLVGSNPANHPQARLTE